MKKAIVLVLLLLILFLASLTARKPGYGQNTKPSQSPERFTKVRAVILEALEKSGAPSISIAVAVNQSFALPSWASLERKLVP